MNDQEVKQYIGHFLVAYYKRPKVLLLKFIFAIVHCLCNLFSLKLWLCVGCLFLFYLFAAALGLFVEYICGGVCYVIKKIIDGVNEIISLLPWSSRHYYDVKAIDALAALVNGECDIFKSPSTTINYWWKRIIGYSLCKKLLWYNTISLTRWMITVPLSFILFQQDVNDQCHQTSLTNDMCAGIIGTMSILNWMVTTGIWIFVGLIILWPLVKFVVRLLNTVCQILYTIIFCFMYDLSHNKKQQK